MTTQGWDRGASALVELSREGLDVPEFRDASLVRLRSCVSFDAAFFATVDPETLLFTAAFAEEPLAAATSLFLDNEFGCADVNKFAHLAGSTDVLGTLDHATRGDRRTSARYRDVLRPLGFGDELRVVLASGGRSWGVLCLHRAESSLGFDEQEIAWVRRVASWLGEGLRRSTAMFTAAPEPSAGDGPGMIILGPDLAVVSMNPQAERWLSELDDIERPTKAPLPLPISAAAVQALRSERGHAPPARVRRAGGGWITVQASRRGAAESQVGVILDAADASQLSSLVLAAHGLTPAQSRVVALVLQGRSTQQIVNELHVSANTVQEHLKAVFDKFGIGSRRELVAALSGRPR